MRHSGCPRCASTVEFRGKAASCLQCGWELLVDGIHPLEAEKA